MDGWTKYTSRIPASDNEIDRPRPPEQKLLRGVLLRALYDAFKEIEGIEFHEKVSARRWLFDLEMEDPFSFGWVCRHLDLCPATLQVIMRTDSDRITLLVAKM